VLIISIILGALIGLVLGLTGAGGGILAVPVLTIGLGWTMTQAAPIALISVGAAATIGAINGFRNGLVRYRAASLIAFTGLLLVPVGQHLARNLDERYLVGSFAAVMLIVAMRLWRNATLSNDENTSERVRNIQFKAGYIVWNIRSFLTLSAIGILTGFTTGLLGVGGGFIIVPALLRCSNISLEGIVATSLMVIAIVSGGGFISACMTGHVELSITTGLFVIGAASGMLLGRHYATRLPKHFALQTLASLIILVSIMLFYKIM
jgi:uncharacterized membrane protein YfcA